MLLKTSISNTKKFFKRSIQNFKSFFSGRGYQKLPKTPLCNPFPCNGGVASSSRSYHQLDNFYTDFIDPWNGEKERQKNEEADLIKLRSSTKKEQEKKIKYGHEEGSCRRGMEERSCFVTEKLRELEMMDGDNVLDIEEVLHYYSRLTCPVYLDIVDQFFMGMYSELFQPEASAFGSGRLRNKRTIIHA